jgi:glycosyltransferase involved in cell wall biosynthesis
MLRGAFHENFGKSQALHAGFAKAQGDVIITMDADLQDSRKRFGLYNMITTQILTWYQAGKRNDMTLLLLKHTF